jgi:glycerophosphoryl diester phosphodiesterase
LGLPVIGPSLKVRAVKGKLLQWNPNPLAMLAVLCAGTISPMNAAEPAAPALKLLNTKRPLIIAHRGYPQFAPENTQPAFKLAIEAGADLVELDYHHSQDGVPVIMHDFTLDRTTDAVKRWGEQKIRLDGKTAAELQTLDAGAWFSPGFAGTKVLLLAEALDFIQGNGGVTLIERKEGDAATCVKLLRKKNLINQLVVQSFDWEYLKKFHELEPTQVLGALGPPGRLADGSKPGERPKLLDAAWLDDLVKSGAKAVVWNDQVSKAAVKDAHKRGLKVWVYTINDPAAANKLLDMGVDGIITNNTSLLWRTLALRAMK